MNTKKFENKIDLENEGQLSLFFIGTGSAFSKAYFQTNLVIVKGKDNLLVDCGTLCPYCLENTFNTKSSEFHNMILTHPHADHVGGVEEMALVARYFNKEKINLIITDEFKKKLWNETLRGGIQFSESGKMTFGDYFNQIKPVKVMSKPFEMYEVNFGSINIKLFRTRHVTTKSDSLKNSQISYGILFDEKVLFTGDTQFNPEQLKWFMNNFRIEQIFHDCDVGGYSSAVHASYDQLKSLPAEIKNKILLCHYNSCISDFTPVKDGFAGIAESGWYYNFS